VTSGPEIEPCAIKVFTGRHISVGNVAGYRMDWSCYMHVPSMSSGCSARHTVCSPPLHPS